MDSKIPKELPYEYLSFLNKNECVNRALYDLALYKHLKNRFCDNNKTHVFDLIYEITIKTGISSTAFTINTGLNKNYFSNICKFAKRYGQKRYNKKIEFFTLVKICVGLDLGFLTIQLLFKMAGYNIENNYDDYSLLLSSVFSNRKTSIYDVEDLLTLLSN